MNNHELAERGRQAREAFDFVGPALEAARAEYMEALTTIAAKEPWAADKITKLAIARNVIDKVEAHLRIIMAHGDEAARKLEKAREIAELPAAKKRWL